MVKKMTLHTLIYGLAPQVPVIAGFFSLPLITSQLTELDYGISEIIITYTTAFSILSTFGLNIVLINSFYHSFYQYKWIWRQIYGFLNIWNIFFALFMTFVLYFIIPKEAESNKWTIIALNVLPIIFFGRASIIGSKYFHLMQKPLQIAVRTSFFGLLSVSLNVYFIYFLRMGYMGWFWTTFIVNTLTNISYWYPVNIKLNLTPIYNFKWKSIKKSLKVSLPLIPHIYSGYLLNASDKAVMHSLNVSTGNIGKYGVAYKIGGLCKGIGAAMGIALAPLMYEKYREKDDIGVRNMIFLAQIVILFLTFVSSIWMKEIFQVMIKNDVLSKVYPLAIIITMSYSYIPMYLAVINKLFYLEKTNVLWKITTFAGVTNVILNFTLIPIYGYKVAAYTTFVSLMLLGFSGFYFKHFKQVNKVRFYHLFWLFTIIILTLLSIYIVELKLSYKIFITLICSLITTCLLFFVYKKENNRKISFQSIYNKFFRK